MFLDDNRVNAIEFHSHGPSSSERVAADIVFSKAIGSKA